LSPIKIAPQKSPSAPTRPKNNAFEIIKEKSSPTKIVLCKSPCSATTTNPKREKSYACHLCNFKSFQGFELGNHLVENHIVQCQICDFKTVDQDFLSRHSCFRFESLKSASPLKQFPHEESHQDESLVESKLMSSPKKRRRSNSSPEKSCKSRKSQLNDIIPPNEFVSPITKRRSLRHSESPVVKPIENSTKQCSNLEIPVNIGKQPHNIYPKVMIEDFQKSTPPKKNLTQMNQISITKKRSLSDTISSQQKNVLDGVKESELTLGNEKVQSLQIVTGESQMKKRARSSPKKYADFQMDLTDENLDNQLKNRPNTTDKKVQKCVVENQNDSNVKSKDLEDSAEKVEKEVKSLRIFEKKDKMEVNESFQKGSNVKTQRRVSGRPKKTPPEKQNEFIAEKKLGYVTEKAMEEKTNLKESEITAKEDSERSTTILEAVEKFSKVVEQTGKKKPGIKSDEKVKYETEEKAGQKATKETEGKVEKDDEAKAILATQEKAKRKVAEKSKKVTKITAKKSSDERPNGEIVKNDDIQVDAKDITTANGKGKEQFEEMSKLESSKNQCESTKRCAEEKAKTYAEKGSKQVTIDASVSTKKSAVERAQNVIKESNKGTAEHVIEDKLQNGKKVETAKKPTMITIGTPFKKQFDNTPTEEIVFKVKDQISKSQPISITNKELYTSLLKPIPAKVGSLKRRFMRMVPLICNFYACKFCEWKFERKIDHVKHMTNNHANFWKRKILKKSPEKGKINDVEKSQSIDRRTSIDSEMDENEDNITNNYSNNLNNDETTRNKLVEKLSATVNNSTSDNCEVPTAVLGRMAYESLIEEHHCLICG
jgi:hypothetical protein